MEFLFDLHTHTIASGHAYSTLKENIEEAYKTGLRAYGFSEHAQTVPGSVNNIYFCNLKVIPEFYKNMRVYAGVEANIIDYEGRIDIDEYVSKKVDYIIASLHTICIEPSTLDRHMNAYLKVMENPYVKIIGHPDDSRYEIDYEELVKGAKKNKVVLELNNSSLKKGCGRVGGVENNTKMLKMCKKYGVYIVCNTDSHYYTEVGKFDEAKALLKEVDFPKDLIINTNLDNLSMVINKSEKLFTAKDKCMI